MLSAALSGVSGPRDEETLRLDGVDSEPGLDELEQGDEVLLRGVD